MTDPNPTPDPTPTPADRRRLVNRLQAQALARENPLAANLGVLTGDMALLAHVCAERIRTELDAGGPSSPHLGAEGDRCLKFVRQFDRMAQLEQRLNAEADGRDG